MRNLRGLGEYDEFGIEVANNYPMDGGQTNPWAAPPVAQTTGDYGEQIYSDINSTNYTYDTGASSLNLPAFKVAEVVRDAAASGKPVSEATVRQMQSWGIDLKSIVGLAGDVYKLTQTAQGTYSASPVNVNAQNAIAAAQAQKNTMMLVLAGIAGVLALKFM